MANPPRIRPRIQVSRGSIWPSSYSVCWAAECFGKARPNPSGSKNLANISCREDMNLILVIELPEGVCATARSHLGRQRDGGCRCTASACGACLGSWPCWTAARPAHLPVRPQPLLAWPDGWPTVRSRRGTGQTWWIPAQYDHSPASCQLRPACGDRPAARIRGLNSHDSRQSEPSFHLGTIRQSFR